MRIWSRWINLRITSSYHYDEKFDQGVKSLPMPEAIFLFEFLLHRANQHFKGSAILILYCNTT